METPFKFSRYALAVFLSATFSLKPSVYACEDTWQHDEWTTGYYETDSATEHCYVTQWESEDYHCTQVDGQGVNCAIENHMRWDDFNCVQKDPPPPDYPPTCNGETCSVCGNPNHFQANDGNATRKVDDIHIAGAADGKLTWTRIHNTTPRGAWTDYFGVGGDWRHNWQYELLESPSALPGNRPNYELILPSGVHRVFRATSAGAWAVASSFNEQFTATADGFEVMNAAGGRLEFTRVVDSGGANRFEMRRLTDPHGLITKLDYNEKGYLTAVTEPAGRQLSLFYTDHTFQAGRWTIFGSITSPAAPGQWVEIVVPEQLRSAPFRCVQLVAPTGKPLLITDAEFFAPGSTTPLTGVARGSAASAASAFDGTASLYQSKRGSVNFVVCDLGDAHQSKISRIRVLASPGEESALVGVSVLGMLKVPEVCSLLTKVTGSDGRTVSYNYAKMSDPYSTQECFVLAGAHYADGTEANYIYSYATVNRRLLLTEADDPRYVGRANRIRYAYHDNENFGMIHQEINPATGGVYSSLELNSSDPEQRIVRYSELRQVSYKVSAAAHNRATERTDSLGRKERFEYAENGNGRLAAKIDYQNRRSDYVHDSHGRSKSIFEKQKFAVQNVRDDNGRLLKKRDRQGRETTIERDQKGRIARTRASDGAVREFSYDTLGRLASFKQRDGGLHAFTYNSRGLKTSWTNPLGHTTTYGYDAQDRLVTIVDPLGRLHRREVNERGLTTKTIEPDGTSQQYTYDKYGHTTSITDEQGRIKKRVYDELGRLTREEDPVARITTFDYTELPQGCGSCTLVDHPSRIVHSDGMIEKMLYDSEGRLLARTLAADTPTSATTSYAYDNDDHLVSETDPLGRITRYTYDDEDRRVSMMDALGRVTKWAYDDHGNVTKVTSPDGGVVLNEYDRSDRLIARKDADGNLTRFTYDDLGNRNSLKDPSGKVTQFVYHAHLQTRTLYPDGKSETREYDSLRRPIKTVSSDGLTVRTTYDAGNRVLLITDSMGRQTSFTYDSIGNRLSATNPLGNTTHWTYDDRGNILTTTRPDGTTTRSTYDSQDHLLTSVDAAGATTTYTYDNAGNQVSLTDARGSTYRFGYDALHRKTSTTYPDGSEEKWTYDLVGNQTTYTTRAAQIKTITYNAANQPITESWSPSNAAPNVAYNYDAAGHLVQVDNGQVLLNYTYDKLGRLASETSDLGALVPGLVPQTVKYNYDELSRLSDLVYPGRTKVSYGYDIRGRILTIGTNGGSRSPLATYEYDQTGRIARLTRDNEVDTNYKYDLAGRLTDITHLHGGTVLASSHYTLDQLGRRTRQIREDGLSEIYGYDTNGQLSSTDYRSGLPIGQDAVPVARQTLAYDSVGNRTQVGNLSSTSTSRVTYTSNALNQYTEIASSLIPGLSRLSYDLNGNLTNDGNQTYTYDAQNRLVSVNSISPAIRMECVYDARSRCALRKYYTLNSQNQWVLNQTDSRASTYDTAWNVLTERNLNGAQLSEYIHGQHTNDVIRAELILPKNYSLSSAYPLLDGLGSTVALANDRGRTISRYRYDVHGRPEVLQPDYSLFQTNAILPAYRFLFTGQEWLGINLLNYKNRLYSVNSGRFLQVDPIRMAGDALNMYRYTFNDSVNFSDPYGLCCELEETVYTIAYNNYKDAVAAARSAMSAFSSSTITVVKDGVTIAGSAAIGAAGAILTLAPEPTGTTKAIGIGSIIAGIGGLIVSGFNFSIDIAVNNNAYEAFRAAIQNAKNKEAEMIPKEDAFFNCAKANQ